jgi:hypothetical protein
MGIREKYTGVNSIEFNRGWRSLFYFPFWNMAATPISETAAATPCLFF